MEQNFKGNALTREQISKLTDEELVAQLPPEAKELIIETVRPPFTKAPAKRADEGEGDYRKRKRESSAVNDVEYALAVRENCEEALFTRQRDQKFLDNMAESLDPAESAAVAARLAAHDERMNVEGGRVASVVSRAAWERGAPAAPPPKPTAPATAPAPKPNPTRPAPRRSGKSRK